MDTKENLKKLWIYKHLYVPNKERKIKNQIVSDPKKYIIERYYHFMKRWPNIEKPERYTEKIQCIKLYDHNPIYTQLADKVRVREYLSKEMNKAINEGLISLPKLYGVYKSPFDIDLNKLPKSFVLKSNHASGHIIIVENKEKLEWKKAINKMKNWLNINYYYMDAEWQYKDMNPQIICEELLEADIVDYRIFCFKGEPFFTKVTRHNYEDQKHPYYCNTYYNDWTEVGVVWNSNYIKADFNKPDKWNQMLEIARKLSNQFEFVRVDLYIVEKKIFFSELTFTPNSGFEPDLPEEWDKMLGSKFEVKVY